MVSTSLILLFQYTCCERFNTGIPKRILRSIQSFKLEKERVEKWCSETYKMWKDTYVQYDIY